MTSEDASVLIEEAGKLVSHIKIKDPSNGCRFNVKLKQGRVIIRVLHSSSIQWSLSLQVMLPGEPLCQLSDKRTVLLLARLTDGLFEAEVPIIVTYSLVSRVSLRIKTIIGDLAEGHSDLRFRLGESIANRWLVKQVTSSIGHVVWQIARYDITAQLKDSLLWFLPWYSPLCERVQVKERSGTIRFSAKAG